MSKILLTKEELDLVKLILKPYISKKDKVFVYGSRVADANKTNPLVKKPKKYSDLDLAIELHNKKSDLFFIGQIKASFDESLFPYTVDVIDLNEIDEDFRKNIFPLVQVDL
ncbi:MAG: nucleotidyltransferase family protein [Alphaproteobacteria bacterium]|jgi:hypothetical protein